jgi:glyoxylate/hydroxypyruvate reductase A
METEVPLDAPARLRASKYAPHPYGMTPPSVGGALFPGDEITFRIKLFGPAMHHVVNLIGGLAKMAMAGMGKGRGKMALARVVDPDLTSRMSEYVVLHCLIALRQQRLYDRQQREAAWIDDRNQPAARDVRVGILGMGVLGLDAAGKLMALGFDVACWSRTRRDVQGLASFAGAEGLGPFLGRTDILVNLLPATPDTAGILNRGMFTQLARDGRLGAPMLINAGRGASQDEDDILACLDDGTLQHATLDVFRAEPLPAASRFWSHPGVTITPHNAAMSDPDAICALIARQIDRLERGLPLEYPVERSRGY